MKLSASLHAAIRRRQPGLALAVISFGLGLFWAAALRPLAAPDEPAYLQTVMQVRDEHILPEIHFDFSQNPQGQVLGAPGNAAARSYIQQAGIGDPIRLLAYQTVQPPLYFLIAAPLAELVPNTPSAVLYLSRLVSALFGAGTIYFCWAATRELAPQARMWAVGVAAVIAFLPQFCFNNARVANDSLVNCLGMAVLYVCFRGLRRPDYDRWMIGAGALLGLALLSKLTAVVLLPGLALVVLFRAFQVPPDRDRWRARVLRATRMAMGLGGSAALVAGWWFVRNVIAYGEPTGTAAANQFWKLNLAGLNWNDPVDRADFILSTWKTFWGYFGWADIAMPADFYVQTDWLARVLVGLSGIAALWIGARWLTRRAAIALPTWQALAILAVTTVTMLYSFVQFSLTVARQSQGRYLFLLLLPAALIFTGGLAALPPGRPLKVLALSVPIIWLAAMNAVGVITVR